MMGDRSIFIAGKQRSFKDNSIPTDPTGFFFPVRSPVRRSAGYTSYCRG